MKNYKNHKDTIIKYISIVDIVRIIDYATELSSLIPQENEILDDFDEIFSQLIKTEKELRTNKKCPHCGGTLYLSDVPHYEYVCPICDENFYEIEV